MPHTGERNEGDINSHEKIENELNNSNDKTPSRAGVSIPVSRPVSRPAPSAASSHNKMRPVTSKRLRKRSYERRIKLYFTIAAIVIAAAVLTAVLIKAFSSRDNDPGNTDGTGIFTDDTAAKSTEPYETESDVTSDGLSDDTTPNTTPNTTPDADTDPVTDDTTHGTTPDTTPDTTPELPYDYGAAVPYSENAGASYFDNAVFLGDSRTEGLYLYSGITNAQFISERGLNVSTVLTKSLDKYGGKTAFETLSEMDFGKIYISFGLNELGWIPSVFESRLGKLIESIRSLRPDAIIYIQNVIPITAEADAVNPYGGNASVWKLNEAIADACREHEAYLIDLGSYFADADGVLDASHKTGSDGQHFHGSGDGYKLWVEYLLTHTIK